MKTYEFDLLKDFGTIEQFYLNIGQIFAAEEFREYIADKCQHELDIICQQSLNDINSFGEEGKYMLGMFVEIATDYIILGNNSQIDIASKKYMSEEAKSNYADKLSLAKIVEFGVGSKGINDETWRVNVNSQKHIEKYGKDGWYYIDDNGILHWTYGFEGKLIFHKLMENVKENISTWVVEYLIENLKD